VYASALGQVVDIVVSHQGVGTKSALVSQLMSALVLPAPEHYRPLLRRLAALGARPTQALPLAPHYVDAPLPCNMTCMLLHAWHAWGQGVAYKAATAWCMLAAAAYSKAWATEHRVHEEHHVHEATCMELLQSM
jgi:hypothetical protein